jgi:hypothetical protein
MAKGVPARLTKDSHALRAFGLTVGGAFGVLGSVLWLWRGHATVGQSLLVVGAVLAVFGIAAPSSLARLERAWMGLARAISTVTTPIFMALVYFTVFVPVGLIRRTFGTRVLEEARGTSTAWLPVRQSRSMERQF